MRNKITVPLMLGLMLSTLSIIHEEERQRIPGNQKEKKVQEECDIKTTEKGKWCVKCKKAVDEKDIKEGKCECGKDIEEGRCEECDKEIAGKDIKQSKCPLCKKELKEAELCVKKTYKCEDCWKTLPNSNQCKKCKKDAKEQVFKALVIFKCPKCNKISETEGECDDEKCEAKLVKTCLKSGEYPHVCKKPSKDDDKKDDNQN